MEEDQAKQALARLEAIDLKVKQVQDKLETRLPSRRVHLAALACGVKWRLQAQKHREDADNDEELQVAAKRVRTELGAFDYQVKEQAELLTRYLCELDDILSFGNAEVKEARKALVVFIQSLFSPADAMKAQSAKLKQLGERLLEQFLPPLTPPVTPQQTFSTQEESADDAIQSDETEEATEDMQAPPERTKDEDEDMADSKQDDDDKDDDDSEDEDDNEDEEEEEFPDETMEDEVEKEKPKASTPAVRPQPSVAPAAPTQIDVGSLPVWRPYYQLQRRPDGVYLLAKLHNTDPRNVRVQWSEPTGALRISGFKLPTQKDVLMSRLSGAPTFGRFEIVERFPRNVLNMDQATQQLREDGTLEIRMPYFYVQSPVRMQRSWFQPRDCFVW